MSNSFEWTLAIDEDLEAIPPFNLGGNEPQFVSAAQSDDRIRARYFVRRSTSEIVGHIHCGQLAQGPPGYAHGGAIAAILDEVMGMAAWQKGLNVVAAEIWVKYRKPTPLWTEFEAHSWVESVEGRRAEVRSRLQLTDGTVLVEGGGTFVNIGKDRYQEFVKEADAVRDKNIS